MYLLVGSIVSTFFILPLYLVHKTVSSLSRPSTPAETSPCPSPAELPSESPSLLDSISPRGNLPPPTIFMQPPPEEVVTAAKKLPFRHFLRRVIGLELDEEPDASATAATSFERVEAILSIPLKLEKMLAFGCILCWDIFLYYFAFLPLCLTQALLAAVLSAVTGTMRITRQQVCYILTGGLLSVCYMALTCVDIAVVYHDIRGQSIMKLYVIFNMLDVFEKLCSSFGEDVLDSLFWTVQSGASLSAMNVARTVRYFLIASLYICVHALVHFWTATTLSVALNSDNSALFSVLMANNFVELKGSVFKKFDARNLFQIACADVVERFRLFMYVTIVVLQNSSRVSAAAVRGEPVGKLGWDIMSIVGMEILVDWSKHMFVTKFNRIPASVYDQYAQDLAEDVKTSFQNHSMHHEQVTPLSRRLGFVAMPLVCLVARTLLQHASTWGWELSLWNISFALLAFACVVAAKVLLGMQMLGYVATRFSDKEDMSPMSRSRGVSLSNNAKLTRPMSPFISASAKPISPPQNSVMPSAPTSSASAGSGLGSLLGRPKLQ